MVRRLRTGKAPVLATLAVLVLREVFRPAYVLFAFAHECFLPLQIRRTARLPSAVRLRAGVTQPLLGRSSVELVRRQNEEGFIMKELGLKLQDANFEASGLRGQIHVAVDGLQRLRSVAIERGALRAAGGHEELAEELLKVLQTAHDSSSAGTRGDVWQLYKNRASLLQAPFTQIGIGNTAEDPWENVAKTPDSLRMAAELFDNFDEDGNGHWSHHETSIAQLATEGTEMSQDAFNALVIAIAPDGGRDLTEADLILGLTKKQVVELYTDAAQQRKLGFVLNVERDHATVFGHQEAFVVNRPTSSNFALLE